MESINHFRVLSIIQCVGTLIKSLDAVKGSIFYSERLLKILEEYDRTKLGKVCKEDEGQSADAINQLEILLRIDNEVRNNSEEKIIEFYDELLQLALKYGVNEEILNESILRIE